MFNELSHANNGNQNPLGNSNLHQNPNPAQNYPEQGRAQQSYYVGEPGFISAQQSNPNGSQPQSPQPQASHPNAFQLVGTAYGPQSEGNSQMGANSSPVSGGQQAYSQTQTSYSSIYGQAKAEEKQTAKVQSGSEPPKKRKGGMVLAVLAVGACACMLTGVVGGLVGFQLQSVYGPVQEVHSPQTSDAQGLKPTSQVASPTHASSGEMSVREIAAKAAPAVVAINTESLRQSFWGTQTIEGAGSGVLISKDGVIVTNNHVINSATETKVTLADGTSYPAKIIASDESSDLAVIKITADKAVPYLTFGDSTTLQVGDPVVAIGNPLGELQGTVTAGYISALHRDVMVEGQLMSNVMQTDAAINAGNSGGALLNSRGELIGINVAKFRQTGVEGIAFSIPSETVQPTIEQLQNNGHVRRLQIGLTGANVPAQNPYGLTPGILVTSVEPNGPAAAAGLQVRDIITAVNGKSVQSVQQLIAVRNRLKEGESMTLTVDRNGQSQEIQVTPSYPDNKTSQTGQEQKTTNSQGAAQP